MNNQIGFLAALAVVGIMTYGVSLAHAQDAVGPTGDEFTLVDGDDSDSTFDPSPGFFLAPFEGVCLAVTCLKGTAVDENGLCVPDTLEATSTVDVSSEIPAFDEASIAEEGVEEPLILEEPTNVEEFYFLKETTVAEKFILRNEPAF